MPYIRYEYDPNDPNSKAEARARAYGQYFLGFIFLWGSVGSVIYFICSLVSLFEGNYSESILYSSGLLVLVAIVDFYILFYRLDKKDRKEVARKYFLFFFGGALDLSGLIAIVVSVSSLCHNGSGAILLICSVFAVLIVTFLVVIVYRRIEGYGAIRVKLFTERDLPPITTSTFCANKKDGNATIPEIISECIFCHKCGKRLPADSEFCSACGTRLK